MFFTHLAECLILTQPLSLLLENRKPQVVNLILFPFGPRVGAEGAGGLNQDTVTPHWRQMFPVAADSLNKDSRVSGHFNQTSARVPSGLLMTCSCISWHQEQPTKCLSQALSGFPAHERLLPSRAGPVWGAEGSVSAEGLFIPWLLCWAIQQGCQFFHLADYYIALKREGFILVGCYIDCYRDVAIFTGCYIDWERERGRIAGSCHIDCYRKDLYLSSTSALGSPRQDINANSSAHPLLWVLFV